MLAQALHIKRVIGQHTEMFSDAILKAADRSDNVWFGIGISNRAFNARVGSEILMDCNGETNDANTNKTVSDV